MTKNPAAVVFRMKFAFSRPSPVPPHHCTRLLTCTRSHIDTPRGSPPPRERTERARHAFIMIIIDQIIRRGGRPPTRPSERSQLWRKRDDRDTRDRRTGDAARLSLASSSASLKGGLCPHPPVPDVPGGRASRAPLSSRGHPATRRAQHRVALAAGAARLPPTGRQPPAPLPRAGWR